MMPNRDPRDGFFLSHPHTHDILFYFILSSEINPYQKQIKVISITSEMISAYSITLAFLDYP